MSSLRRKHSSIKQSVEVSKFRRNGKGLLELWRLKTWIVLDLSVTNVESVYSI